MNGILENNMTLLGSQYRTLDKLSDAVADQQPVDAVVKKATDVIQELYSAAENLDKTEDLGQRANRLLYGTASQLSSIIASAENHQDVPMSIGTLSLKAQDEAVSIARDTLQEHGYGENVSAVEVLETCDVSLLQQPTEVGAPGMHR